MTHGPLHLREHEIEDLTVGGLILALDDDTEKRRGPEGFVPMSAAEMQLYAARRRSMSLHERLAQARGW